jgi:hypothetical protein
VAVVLNSNVPAAGAVHVLVRLGGDMIGDATLVVVPTMNMVAVAVVNVVDVSDMDSDRVPTVVAVDVVVRLVDLMHRVGHGGSLSLPVPPEGYMPSCAYGEYRMDLGRQLGAYALIYVLHAENRVSTKWLVV